jgi:hypothetical protein
MTATFPDGTCSPYCIIHAKKSELLRALFQPLEVEWRDSPRYSGFVRWVDTLSADCYNPYGPEKWHSGGYCLSVTARCLVDKFIKELQS